MPNRSDSPSPLSAVRLHAALAAAGLQIPPTVIKLVTESTNSDAVALAAAGAPGWTVVAADEQRRGRGRLDRSWVSFPGDALLFSVILRPPPTVAPDRLGWIPLLAGVAAAEAVVALGIPVGLKWPNDLVVDGTAADGSAGPRKLGGILSERSGGAIVVGIGINTAAARDRLPIPAATSLALEGVANVDRADLLAGFLARAHGWWDRWLAAGGDPVRSGLLEGYQRWCLTIGCHVRVQLPGRDAIEGVAVGVDHSGCLLVADDDAAVRAISAGDVLHVRPRGAK